MTTKRNKSKMTELTHLLETRKNFLNVINSLTTEQLNHIPEGLNNNIIWNFGHAIVTQQLLCYKLSNNPIQLSEELVEKYRKGSQPSNIVSEQEIEVLKKLALELPLNLETDLETKNFQEYKEYTTSFNVTLSTIEEAIKFNNIHEGLHLGYAMAIRKMV